MKKDHMFSSIGKVFQYMKKSIPAVICALVLAAVGAVLTIIGPDKIGKMTTIMQEGLYGKIDFRHII